MGQINGLPLHVLVVHFVVVAVPLAAVLVVAGACWPAARRRLGLVTPVVALVTLASVPVATQAGEWLRDRLPDDPLIQRHAELGDGLLPWTAGLAVVAAAVWALDRYAATARSRRRPVRVGGGGTSNAEGAGALTVPAALTGRPARIALAVLAVVLAVGAVVQVYRIGDSGARAAWNGRVSSIATGHGDDH